MCICAPILTVATAAARSPPLSYPGWYSDPAFMGWLSVAVGAVGVCVAVVGLSIALKQISGVKSVAEAGRDAAESAKQQVDRVMSVVTLGDLCASGRELVVAIRTRNYGLAASKALDMRQQIARARYQTGTKTVMPQKQWQTAITDIANVQELCEHPGEESDSSETQADLHRDALSSASNVLEQLNSAAASAANDAGAVNG